MQRSEYGGMFILIRSGKEKQDDYVTVIRGGDGLIDTEGGSTPSKLNEFEQRTWVD